MGRGQLHWEFAVVTIVSAYVIGAVFFRQDPQKPDSCSALHVWMNAKNKERNGLAVQAKTELSSPFQLSGSDARLPMTLRLRAYVRSKKYMRLLGLDSQFPYLHLRCYLAGVALLLLGATAVFPWQKASASSLF